MSDPVPADPEAERDFVALIGSLTNFVQNERVRAYNEGVDAALGEERQTIADEARRYASHYPQSSDGRNTFTLLAEWIESRSAKSV